MRHKIYALINVMGLSVGICACIVIYLISSYELGVDNFHPDRDRIFRVGGKVEESNGNRFYVTSIPPPSIATLRSEIPEIENIAGYYPYSTKISIFEGGKKIRDFDDKALPGKSTGTIIADSAYFSIFKYEWLAGSEAASLRDPFKVVISEKKARIYFGAEPLKDIIGKEIVYGDSLRVTVSGIIKNWEKHTDFPYSDFISFSTIKHSFLKNRFPDNNWRPERENPWICAFVKIPKRYDVGNLDVKLSAFADRHMTKDPLNKFSFQLEPLSDVHFNNDYSHDGIDKAYRPGVYCLIGMAFFILMIAAINFINLSTAQSVQRAKEIGIRKVLGSSSGSLKVQFLMEAFVLTFFAACIAVAMVLPVLAVFKNYISSNVHFTIFDPFTIIFILVVIIATSLIAGFYPAQVLSSYSPIHTIKGEMGSSRKGRNIDLRRALIVFQFTISLVFIIIAIVVSEQIRFMVHSDFGFKSDAIITVNNWSDSSRKMKLLSEEIRHMPGVVDVVLQGKAPMGVVVMEEPIKYKGKNEINTLASIQAGDENFIPFYQIKLLAGRNLVQSDSLREFVINETFSRVLGFKNLSAAIGNYLYSNGRAYPIVGVVSDFHENSFKESIGSVVIGNISEKEKSLGIKLATDAKQIGSEKTTLLAIEKAWKDVFPDQEFNYSFLDDSIASLAQQEDQTKWLMNIAMSIAIFISCIGLFGLAMYSSGKRKQEIGIRKVLGANAFTILILLSKEFISLIIIAILIASPIAWFFMHRWLQNFAYHVPISWWVFLLAGIVTIFIAMFTVSFQTIKAAMANPIKSLRTDLE